MKFLKNKIGADKILSVYWFAILFIIAAGILAMIYVFYNSPFDVRQIEAEVLSSKVAECISHQGILDSKWISGNLETGNLQISGTCQTEQECQKVIGKKIVSVVSGIKNDLGILDIDGSVKQSGVAENFECLVLQIATQESTLRHCVEFQKDGNPLYCDGKREEVKSLSNERETSLGVLQVNTKVHDVDAENFEEGIKYAVKNVLTKGYDSSSKDYVCNGKTYSGWESALRNYNGWNTACTDSSGKLIGDPNYVENVISNKGFVQNAFPEFCSQGKTIEPTFGNLESECNLNFNSEFDNEQFYVQVDFYNLQTFESENLYGRRIINSKPLKTIFDGNQNLKADCTIQKVDDFEKQAKCFEGSFYSIDENNKPYVVVISSAVRKTEKNARI